jgi:hypothetical protein
MILSEVGSSWERGNDHAHTHVRVPALGLCCHIGNGSISVAPGDVAVGAPFGLQAGTPRRASCALSLAGAKNCAPPFNAPVSRPGPSPATQPEPKAPYRQTQAKIVSRTRLGPATSGPLPNRCIFSPCCTPFAEGLRHPSEVFLVIIVMEAQSQR